MDGLLVIDKPVGPTSHDVVARVRRAVGERRIGHTGTLDPLASGVLPLVLGRATRLARFLSSSDKSYEAVVRLGFATDTGDREGAPITATHTGPAPGRDAIEQALEAFRGRFLQQPPRYSAKKIGGRRSYAIARDRASDGDREVARPAPAPVSVVVHHLALTALEGDHVSLDVVCSAGFYVRALAQDLGTRLGTGAHLAALRRTRSGDIDLSSAIALDVLETSPDRGQTAVVPLGRMLQRLPAFVLTPDGVRKATHGRELGSSDGDWSPQLAGQPFVRLLAADDGGLVGIAEPRAGQGLLHPSVILM